MESTDLTAQAWSSNESSPKVTDIAPRVPLSQLKVMFVDDERQQRRIGQRMLEQLGCRFQILSDGDEVQPMLVAAQSVQDPFHVVLLDNIMVRMNGEDAVIAIRAAGV